MCTQNPRRRRRSRNKWIERLSPIFQFSWYFTAIFLMTDTFYRGDGGLWNNWVHAQTLIFYSQCLCEPLIFQTYSGRWLSMKINTMKTTTTITSLQAFLNVSFSWLLCLCVSIIWFQRYRNTKIKLDFLIYIYYLETRSFFNDIQIKLNSFSKKV